jgi:hypothetical protein
MPAFRRLRQEECKFKAILGYIVRLHLKKKKSNKNSQQIRNRGELPQLCKECQQKSLQLIYGT